MLHTSYSLMAIHMTKLLVNWLRYLLLFSKKFHLLQVETIATSSQNEHVVTMIEEPEPIRL